MVCVCVLTISHSSKQISLVLNKRLQAAPLYMCSVHQLQQSKLCERIMPHTKYAISTNYVASLHSGPMGDWGGEKEREGFFPSPQSPSELLHRLFLAYPSN